jgi:hypothetical protein
MKTLASKSLARLCLAACLCFLVLAQPSLSLAGGCYSGYCYRAPVRSYSYPVYYPVVQKVVEKQIVQVPQVYYQVASELRDKAIAQLTANSLLPIIGQQVQAAVRQELAGSIQGRVCLELGASTGGGVSTGGGIGSYPAPSPGPNPGPVPPSGPGPSPLPPSDMLAQVQGIFTQYCVECHNPSKKMGNINYADITQLDISTITRGIHLADIGQMPPANQGKQPVPDQVMEVLKQFEYQITTPQGYQGQQQSQAAQAPYPANGQIGPQQPSGGNPMPPPSPEQPNTPPAPQPPAEQPEPAPQPDNPPQAQANPAPTRQATFTLRTTDEPIKILKRPRIRP